MAALHQVGPGQRSYSITAGVTTLVSSVVPCGIRSCPAMWCCRFTQGKSQNGALVVDLANSASPDSAGRTDKPENVVGQGYQEGWVDVSLLLNAWYAERVNHKCHIMLRPELIPR